MEYDEIRLEGFEKVNSDWKELHLQLEERICKLVDRYRNRKGGVIREIQSHNFDILFRMHWDDEGVDWLIRFPMEGRSMFPENKVKHEVAIMQFIAEKTSIPVPRLIAYETGIDETSGLGPFIIVVWVEGFRMSEILRNTDPQVQELILDPNLDQKTFGTLYGQMADILLELWTIDFDAIGNIDYASSSKELPSPVNLCLAK